MIFDPILDIFRGKAVTIPPLDGAFRPNTALDDAAVAMALPAADNLAAYQGKIIASSGAALHDLNGEVLQTHAADVTALAVSARGELAVGLESASLLVGGQPISLPGEIRCITALAYDADGRLWLANGSDRHAPSAWAVDLMQRNATGSIWVQGTDGFRKVAGGLAWPYGLLPDAQGVVVSESWRHRLIRIDAQGAIDTVLHSLPGYPARLTPIASGGAWLALFVPRNRLIEFVLLEHHYRLAMMAEVPREFWIAPALASNRSFLEPLQCGGIRTMGVHKPWSPSRSYGLAVRLDASLTPQLSLHSRANGNRHGICSVLETDEGLYVASRGGDCILTPDLAEAR